MKKNHLILIGFMGTGKSAVAKILATKLKRPLIELDELIEQQEGKKITRIFEEKGEAYFRRIERKTLKQALKKKEAVIATGGGIVLNPLNIKEMKKKGLVICLSSSLQEIKKRTAQNTHRPLLQGKSPFQIIQNLLQYRQPLYKQAGDLFISTTGKTATQTANKILSRL